MQVNPAIIKTGPHKIRKVKKILQENPNIIIIALNEYIKWKLNNSNIPSISMKTFSPYKKYSIFEKKLSDMYTALCYSGDSEFDYAELFRNHLCWETQKSFYFFNCLDRLITRRKINKFYFEPLSQIKRIRHSKCLNRLVIDYFRKKGVEIETI